MPDWELIPVPIPEPLWNLSAAQLLGSSSKLWRGIRAEVLAAASNTCQTCGRPVRDGKGLVCDEVWDYQEAGQLNVARLVAMRALCPLCDRSRHPGMAGLISSRIPPYMQLMRVNHWGHAQAEAAVARAWADWQRRSQLVWVLDVVPELLGRWPVLRPLVGQVGEPGDGTRRVALRRAGMPRRS
jgi:hypothetical protein